MWPAVALAAGARAGRSAARSARALSAPVHDAADGLRTSFGGRTVWATMERDR